MLKNIIIVMAFGAIGCVLRYFFTLKLNTSIFSFGTLGANLLSSYLIGIFAAMFMQNQALSNELKLALITGFCGGFSTFSSFSLEMFELLKSEKFNKFFLAFFAHTFGSILMAFLGFSTFIILKKAF